MVGPNGGVAVATGAAAGVAEATGRHAMSKGGTLMSKRLAALGLAALAFAGAPALAAAPEARPWRLELGTGLSWQPDYSGAGTARVRAPIWVSGEWRSDRWGRFELDSGAVGLGPLGPQLRWSLGDVDAWGAGAMLGYRYGRRDREPALLGDDGSSRLRGLGRVRATVDAGVQGWITVFGVPMFAQLSTPVEQGRGDLGQSAQGTVGLLGLLLPLEPAPGIAVTLLPTVMWADGRQMRAFYGISPAQGAASGYAVYRPSAGWQSAALEVSVEAKLTGPWHFVADIAYRRLLGPASGSPLVESKGAWISLVGVAFRF